MGTPSAPDARTVFFLLSLVVATGTVFSVLRIVGTARERVLAVRMDRYVVSLVLRGSVAVDLESFEQPEFHDRLERAVFASRTEPAMVVTALVACIQAILTVGVVVVALLVMAWWLLPLVIIAAAPTIKTARDERNAGYMLHYDLTESRRARSYLEQLLTGRDEAKEVRAFGHGEVLRQRWDREYDREIAGTVSMHRTYMRRKSMAVLIGDTVVIAVIGVMWVFIEAGHLSPAAGLAVLVALWQLSTRLKMVGGIMNSLGSSIAYLHNLKSFAATQLDAELPVRSSFQALTAKDLGFTYPGASTPALKNVSFTINRGEVVALVGVNGSGKTTLAKLLAGLYSATSGIIISDGMVRDKRYLRSSCSVLFQDFVRYKFSAQDNIALAQCDVERNPDRVRAAASSAGVDELLRGLTSGYETNLSKEFAGGSDLSLGQWQRVALARAFYRDAPLVILDEPTASLDPQAEADLFAHIRGLFSERTILLISHRFSNVRAADRIHVMSDGEIVESGTHQQLLEISGRYARLYNLQADAYRD